MGKKIAFTLAEVLITLTIIGVIAALTIPNLIHKYEEHVAVTKLKKVYSVFSNAYTQAIRENGDPKDWDISPNETLIGADKLYQYIAPYLKVQQYYKEKQGGFADTYSNLNGTPSWQNKKTINNLANGVLEDGTAFAIWNGWQGCTGNGTTSQINNICGAIEVDINGKKGPNKLGVDYFNFVMTSTNIRAHNGHNVCKYGQSNNNDNGLGCTAWVIYKGNMDYLRRDISSEYNF